ncbi:Wadjet anti-phage system protein JetA family protein [Aeromonas sp. 604534]|uniref:Wadjet anti-phage system protein JetA family protein n=1 Tax=Aeromonas sp. 604534 TaxID=2712055 RepID=UPI003B9FABCF
MSFDTLNTNLFKPISGESGRSMLALLVELDAFLDPATLVDEPTPQQVRVFLRDYIANKNLRLEVDSPDSVSGGTAPEQYVYNRLRDTGWVREEQESGYRYVVWMAQDARRLLHFLGSMSAEHPSLGVVCLSVRFNLAEVVKDPTNGSLVRKAADDMESFSNRLRALVGNIREIHHVISGGSVSGSSHFSFYFEEYLGELFLPNIEKLALKGNPNLHASKIRKLVSDIRFSPERLEACAKAYKRDDISNPSTQLVESDLARLSQAFDGIEPLFKKTQDYARRITRRMHEKIKYTVHTPSNMGQKIQVLLDRIGRIASVEHFPSPLIGEEFLADCRLAAPKAKPIPPVPTTRRQPKPLWEKRAYNQLKQEHINFQKCDPVRVANFIEANLGSRIQITTDELRIDTPEDMIAALHLRLLAHGVSKTHPLHPLLSLYSVEFDEDGWTKLEQMAGRRLTIRRQKTMEKPSYGK